MIDIWGRPLSGKKPTTGTQTADDIKKIIEDEIAETLNLTSVDPNEIVVFQDRQGKLKTSNVSADDILVRQRDAAENSIALYSSDGRLKPGEPVSTITDRIATHDSKLDEYIRGYNNFRKNVVYKFFGNPPGADMTLAEIKNLLSRFFFNKETDTMMDKNEIKANYLDIYTDLFKLLEHFERVQKPTNDVVGKFFGTALVAGMTLAEISDAVNKQKLTSEIINKFFEDSKPQDITMKFSDINRYISDQKRLESKTFWFHSFLTRGIGG